METVKLNVLKKLFSGINQNTYRYSEYLPQTYELVSPQQMALVSQSSFTNFMTNFQSQSLILNWLYT